MAGKQVKPEEIVLKLRQVEPGPAEMARQCAVIIAGRFEPDPHRKVRADEGRGQALEVFQRVQDRRAATAPF